MDMYTSVETLDINREKAMKSVLRQLKEDMKHKRK